MKDVAQERSSTVKVEIKQELTNDADYFPNHVRNQLEEREETIDIKDEPLLSEDEHATPLKVCTYHQPQLLYFCFTSFNIT